MKAPLISAVIVLFLWVHPLPAEEKAAPLTLKDGRVFHEWVVIRESGEFLVMRYKGGLAQISKHLLPDALSAKYPLDMAAARAEAAVDRERRRLQEQQSRLIRPIANPQQIVEVDRMQKAQELAAIKSLVFQAARNRAEKFFRYEFTPSLSNRLYALSVDIDTEDPEPWAGIEGLYTVKGKGYLSYHARYRGFDRSTQDFRVRVEIADGIIKETKIELR